MKVILTSVMAAGLSLAGSSRAPDPVATTPASYPELIAAGQREGALSIYSNTDSAEAEPLIQAFRKRYPGIAVEYADQSSVEMYSRFIAEVAAGQGSADFLWGSAMDLTQPDQWKGKVGMLDPERSGLGFLFYANDLQAAPVARQVLGSLGAVDPKLYSSNGAVLERLVSGEHAITYNMIGSYMLKRQTKDPNVGVIYPLDYMMTMSRLT